MSEVNSESSSSSGGSSSSEDEAAGSFDFLASITPSVSSSCLQGGFGSPLASRGRAQASSVPRGAHLTPAQSSESDSVASVLPDRSASDDAEPSASQDATPEEIEEHFNELLRRNLSQYASGVAAAAEAACRSMQTRVAERLSLMLDDGRLAEPGSALVEQTSKRLDSLCQEVGATNTWQKHYELVAAGINADNVAQLKVLQAAAQSEAQEIVRRTRIESKNKLELAATVAKSKLENAKVSIQRTASEREGSIDEQIKGELAAAAAAAERTEAEFAMREEAGKKARKEMIENEEVAKTMKRQIAVIEDRIKQQRQALAQVSQKVRQKGEEVAKVEQRLQVLSGLKKISSG